MAGILSPIGGAGWQFFTNAGTPLIGGLLYTYTAGSTTPLATYTDSTLATPSGNPVVMDSTGRVQQGAIWLQNNTPYKFVLKDSVGNTLGTWDNITGINSSSVVTNEWVSNALVPTYVSATQFTVVGDQRPIFTVNRRVQFQETAGTFYGYVSAATFDGISTTTVTIVADAAGLTASLSVVNYGFLNPTNPSVPQNYATNAGVAATYLTQANAAVTYATITNTAVLSGRNVIINGTMRTAQRSNTYALTAAAAYGSIDRWAALQASTANGVFNRVAAPAGSGFTHVVKLGRNVGAVTSGVITMATPLESTSSIPLAGGPVVLSFYAYAGANFSAASGILNFKLNTGTGTDQSLATMLSATWTGNALPIAGSQALTTTLTRYQATVSLPAGVTQAGVIFTWTPVGTAGADDNVYITGVQLEQGTIATAFDMPDIGIELLKCKRYCRSLGNVTLVGYSFPGGATMTHYDVPMRIGTLVINAVATTATLMGGGTSTAGTASTPAYVGGTTNYASDIQIGYSASFGGLGTILTCGLNSASFASAEL